MSIPFVVKGKIVICNGKVLLVINHQFLSPKVDAGSILINQPLHRFKNQTRDMN